jgi:hypothetical protein
MTNAICYKCGNDKIVPLALCWSCKAVPTAKPDLAVSLVLSEHFSTRQQLEAFQREIKNGSKPTISEQLLSQARQALNDPQMLAVPGSQAANSGNKAAPQPANNKAPAAHTSIERPRTLHNSALQQNPFALLGVTIRDDRRKIVELAEEKSLSLDAEVCQKALSDLTSPRTRLGAEMSWLPGVSPNKAALLLAAMQSDPMSVRKETGLPSLAHMNLLASAFEALDDTDPPEYFSSFILETSIQMEEISAEQVFRDLNEDRSISGFPEVRSIDQVEAELQERKRYYCSAIKEALNRISPSALVTTMTLTVDRATSGGKKHAPELIEELVDGYSSEAHAFLQMEAQNIKKLIDAIKAAASSGEVATAPLVGQLESVARNWDKVAQPIQLSAKARGIDHGPSTEIAFSIRSLVIELFSKHDLLAQSQRLTKLNKELFAELPEFTDLVREDAVALEDISQDRKDAKIVSPIMELCENVLDRIKKNPRIALSEGTTLLGAVPRLNLSSLDISPKADANAKDTIAFVLVQCAISYGNATSNWDACIELLEQSLKLASDKELRQRINENLTIVKANHVSLGNLEPIDKVPSLSTINGIGFTLYGSTETRPSDGSYMATYYFVFFFIPIFPIARYRIIRQDGGYRFLGKGPLRTLDKWHLAVSIILILWLFGSMSGDM